MSPEERLEFRKKQALEKKRKTLEEKKEKDGR